MLKLHAGVSKKVGLPGFSSASASCHIEAELDSTLLNDAEGFQVVVRRAYKSCEQTVQDQIARLTSDGPEVAQPQEVVEVRTSPARQRKPCRRLKNGKILPEKSRDQVP